MNLREDAVVSGLLKKLGNMDKNAAIEWEATLESDINTLTKKWGITDYFFNKDGYTGLVMISKSTIYGDVVVKIYPPFLRKRFLKESYIMKNLTCTCQCPLIDCDDSLNAMLLKRVFPGTYVSFKEDRQALKDMFMDMKEHRVYADTLTDVDPNLLSIIDLTKDELKKAVNYGYHTELLKEMVAKAEELYLKLFKDERLCLLHGDAYFKNVLRDGSERCSMIDPVGYVDAFVFEYMPFYTYELFYNAKGCEKEMEKELLKFFAEFDSTCNFKDVVYIFLVKQLVPSVYEANDGFVRADRYLELLNILY